MHNPFEQYLQIVSCRVNHHSIYLFELSSAKMTHGIALKLQYFQVDIHDAARLRQIWQPLDDHAKSYVWKAQ